ncbi:MAG: hypothetical protein ACP5OB_08135, partial [Candidatus Ratteibacteria bacterium]
YKGDFEKEYIDVKNVYPAIGEWKFIGTIEDSIKFDNYEEGIYYLSLWIFSEDDRKENFKVLTDGNFKIFLNGKEINGGCNLKKNWNLILIKKQVKKDSYFSLGYEGEIKKLSFINPLPYFKTEILDLKDGKWKLKYEFCHPYSEPKIIESGWGGLTVSQIKENIGKLEEKYWYFDGITIRFDPVDNIVPYGGFWPFSYSIMIDYEKLKPQIEILKNLNFKRWKNNFLWVSAYFRSEDNVDWLFDEKIWEKIKENFKVIGRIAKETGCKGIFLDCETPGKKTHIFTYMGYYKENYKFEDCDRKAFERGKEIIEILQKEFPDIVVISVDGSRMVALGRSIFQFHWGNLEKSSAYPGYFHPEMKARLFYSFLSGMLYGAKGNTKIINGEYSAHIGDTINGPLRNTWFFLNVLPYIKDQYNLSPEKIFIHEQVGGRANTYEAPGRERPDAGMYEKIVPLLKDSYCDYIWIYRQSYTPGYGWYEYNWMDKKKREEMEERIKKGEIKPFTPNLIDGKPEEFFVSIEKAKKEFLPEVYIEIDGEKKQIPEEGEIIIDKGKIVKLIGICSSGKIEKILGR